MAIRNPTRHSEETKLAAASIKALRSLGFECIRINSGRRPTPGGGWSIGARTGTPDWMIVHPYCWIEFKDLSKVTPQQRAWHDWAKRNDVPVIVARSVGEAVQFAQRLRRDVTYFERLVIE